MVFKKSLVLSTLSSTHSIPITFWQKLGAEKVKSYYIKKIKVFKSWFIIVY